MIIWICKTGLLSDCFGKMTHRLADVIYEISFRIFPLGISIIPFVGDVSVISI